MDKTVNAILMGLRKYHPEVNPGEMLAALGYLASETIVACGDNREAVANSWIATLRRATSLPDEGATVAQIGFGTRH
jgi:hypothetical protein